MGSNVNPFNKATFMQTVQQKAAEQGVTDGDDSKLSRQEMAAALKGFNSGSQGDSFEADILRTFLFGGQDGFGLNPDINGDGLTENELDKLAKADGDRDTLTEDDFRRTQNFGHRSPAEGTSVFVKKADVTDEELDAVIEDEDNSAHADAIDEDIEERIGNLEEFIESGEFQMDDAAKEGLEGAFERLRSGEMSDAERLSFLAAVEKIAHFTEEEGENFGRFIEGVTTEVRASEKKAAEVLTAALEEDEDGKLTRDEILEALEASELGQENANPYFKEVNREVIDRVIDNLDVLGGEDEALNEEELGAITEEVNKPTGWLDSLIRTLRGQPVDPPDGEEPDDGEEEEFSNGNARTAIVLLQTELEESGTPLTADKIEEIAENYDGIDEEEVTAALEFIGDNLAEFSIDGNDTLVSVDIDAMLVDNTRGKTLAETLELNDQEGDPSEVSEEGFSLGNGRTAIALLLGELEESGVPLTADKIEELRENYDGIDEEEVTEALEFIGDNLAEFSIDGNDTLVAADIDAMMVDNTRGKTLAETLAATMPDEEDN